MLPAMRAPAPRFGVLLPAALAVSFSLGGLACAAAGPRPFPPVNPELQTANQAAGDPFAGRFPLERALTGLGAEGKLEAVIVTVAGEVHCTLDPGHAPLTVANFVGLARGLRPWQDGRGNWVQTPFYDGVTFHRAEARRFVQAGRRDGQESAGFSIQDEISPGDDFERPGALAMANEGVPHTGSAQFFITTGDVSHLEGIHTIFGECEDDARVRQLERDTAAGAAPIITAIRIQRG